MQLNMRSSLSSQHIPLKYSHRRSHLGSGMKLKVDPRFSLEVLTLLKAILDFLLGLGTAGLGDRLHENVEKDSRNVRTPKPEKP